MLITFSYILWIVENIGKNMIFLHFFVDTNIHL